MWRYRPETAVIAMTQRIPNGCATIPKGKKWLSKPCKAWNWLNWNWTRCEFTFGFALYFSIFRPRRFSIFDNHFHLPIVESELKIRQQSPGFLTSSVRQCQHSRRKAQGLGFRIHSFRNGIYQVIIKQFTFHVPTVQWMLTPGKAISCLLVAPSSEYKKATIYS